MHKSVTKWSLALAVGTALAGPAAGHDKAPAAVSPVLTVPQIVPALATRANDPAIAPVVPQHGAIPGAAKFVPDAAGPDVRRADLPRFDAKPKMGDIFTSGGGSGHDGRPALETGATKQVTAKSEASATATTADSSTKSETQLAATNNTEATAATQPAASVAARAPAPACR
jgi:hypothetical protein